MEISNITKGKIEILKNTDGIILGIKDKPQSVYKHTLLVEMLQEDIDAKNDAELICEAFNVANETGMSPIQLNERIKELEDVLLNVNNEYLKHSWSQKTLDKIKTALNNKHNDHPILPM